jgi:hypothetical protein
MLDEAQPPEAAGDADLVQAGGLNNDTFGNLSAAGSSLFDAAVDWAAGLS